MATSTTVDILTTGNEEVVSPARKGSVVAVDLEQIALDHDGYDQNAPIMDKQTPTAEEFRTLRKVPGKMPPIAYMLCAVEFAERASYYGVSMIFGNFVQFPLPKGGNGGGAPPRGTQETAGALGKGLQASSGVSLSFKFLAYTVPILGGWIADTRWGRYKTICVGVAICGVSHVIMAAGAVPSVLERGQGLAPFIISYIMLAFGAGLFKSNISPTLIDQNPHKRPYVETLKSGERVIVDPETTISRILLWFYMLVNVGAFFALATTYAEKRIGYWLAFLAPAIIYFLLPILLIFGYKRTVKVKPGGNDLANVMSIIGIAIKKNGFLRIGRKGYLDVAKPSHMAATGQRVTTKWDDKFVDDVKRTMVACQIFLFFPLFNINDSGIGNVQGSQAAAMTTNGAPNDLLSNFNPLTIIFLIPLLNFVIYPALRRFHVQFGRIRRMTFGFTLVAINGMIGAVLQYRVYKTAPCGYHATDCAEAGTSVSPISVWAQLPIYILGASAECFCNVTAYEVAYSRSPPNMKGLVTSIFLFMNALAQAIGAGTTPALNDPYLIWVFAAPAIAGFVTTPLFYWLFRDLDNDDETSMGLYDLPVEESRDKEKGPMDLERVDEKPESESYTPDEKKGHEIPIDKIGRLGEKEVRV